MASLFKRTRSTWIIQFTDADGRRPKISLGKMTRAQADAIRVRVEFLINAKLSGQPVEPETARWLATCAEGLAEKLARVGLSDVRQTGRLDEFINDYISGRTDVKERTIADLRQTHRRLVEFFGADRNMGSITPAEADAFARHLRSAYALATASKSIVNSRQFFKRAIRARLISVNPFEGIKCGDQSNPDRQYYLTADDTQRILDACPDAEWRAIIALTRYAGLRCPTEVLRLKWCDVNFADGRFVVHASKTEHHANRGIRHVPLFPRLRPYLEDLYELAAPGTEYVINRYRDPGQNLRTTLGKIVTRAGKIIWEKPFQNMRASAETDLVGEGFAIHQVANWIGHTPAIALRHYLQVPEEVMRRAAGMDESGGAKMGASKVQNGLQTGIDGDGQKLKNQTEDVEDEEFKRFQSEAGSSVHKLILRPTGVEQCLDSQWKLANCGDRRRKIRRGFRWDRVASGVGFGEIDLESVTRRMCRID